MAGDQPRLIACRVKPEREVEAKDEEAESSKLRMKTGKNGVQPLWLLAGGYWIWMLWACAGEWSNNQDYNYGWFVPPLALYFWWKRTEQGDAGKGEGGKAGWSWGVILLSLLLIFPIEVVRQTPIHWRPVLWGIGIMAFANTLAVAALTGGRAALQRVVFPAAFMMLAIPWPTFLEGAVAFPLMQAVTGWSVGLLHLLGYPATVAGTTISLPNCTVGVEEACSGLRSLQTALMVGFAAGELARLRLPARAVLLVVAFLMAMAGNQLRVLMLALAGIGGGNEAVARTHDTAGYAVLAVLLCGVGSAAWLLRKISVRGRMQDEECRRRNEETAKEHEGGKVGRVGWVVLATAAAAMVGAHGWFWWRGALAPAPVASMLAPAAGGGFRADENVPAEILGVLQPDEYRYIRELRDGIPGKVAGYHFYWRPRKGNANQLYHRPDRCMPGAGWRIDGEVVTQQIKIGERDMVFNVFPFRGPVGPALMLWGSFLNGEPVEIAFNSDVYLNTANLAQFIRTGTRVYSYEVAALIMPYEQGQRPSPREIEDFANRVFTAAPAPKGNHE